jgi:cell division protease FtsH
MSETFDMMASESVRNQYLDGRTVLSVSDRTAAKIDEETLKIIKEAHKKAIAILEEHKELMRELAEILLDKETITGSEFMHVVRQYMGPDFGLSKAEQKVIDDRKEAEEANDAAEIIHVDEDAVTLTDPSVSSMDEVITEDTTEETTEEISHEERDEEHRE